MVKEFVLAKKDVGEKLIKDKFKSRWWVIAFTGLFILATIGVFAYSIFAKLAAFIYVSALCFLIADAFLGFWSLNLIKSNNKMLEVIFGDKEDKALEVDILEDKLLIYEPSSEQEPTEYRYLDITKINHTNDYSVLHFGKKVWLVIPNNILYPEEIEFVVKKYEANKSKKIT